VYQKIYIHIYIHLLVFTSGSTVCTTARPSCHEKTKADKETCCGCIGLCIQRASQSVYTLYQRAAELLSRSLYTNELDPVKPAQFCIPALEDSVNHYYSLHPSVCSSMYPQAQRPYTVLYIEL
jgi:hypothetical protein